MFFLSNAGNVKEITVISVGLSDLLYGSESWTLYAQQERRLNVFHPRCLRRILYASNGRFNHIQQACPQKRRNDDHPCSSITTTTQMGHVSRMEDSLIPKDGQLATGTGCWKTCPSLQGCVQEEYVASAVQPTLQLGKPISASDRPK